jgi:hypothetical protein
MRFRRLAALFADSRGKAISRKPTYRHHRAGGAMMDPRFVQLGRRSRAEPVLTGLLRDIDGNLDGSSLGLADLEKVHAASA